MPCQGLKIVETEKPLVFAVGLVIFVPAKLLFSAAVQKIVETAKPLFSAVGLVIFATEKNFCLVQRTYFQNCLMKNADAPLKMMRSVLLSRYLTD